jgi:hypothetical protein
MKKRKEKKVILNFKFKKKTWLVTSDGWKLPCQAGRYLQLNFLW